ncbi:MAG: LicD family protein, partial [Clostridia bacterium]|nr:LicD family protein [Clostridia bacterium]
NENQNIYRKLKVKTGRFFSFFISTKKIRELIEKNESRFENRDAKYYLNIYSAYSLEKELIKREWLRGNHNVLFEGHLFPTVSDTDKYLTHLYGDYMTIPKKKERYQRHEERF